jgi:hypothetical protein
MPKLEKSLEKIVHNVNAGLSNIVEKTKRLEIFLALRDTLFKETVPFGKKETLLCIDGRELPRDSITGNNLSNADTMQQSLEKRGEGEIHFPGGVYGLFLHPIVETLKLNDTIAHVINATHEVFAEHDIPFMYHDDDLGHNRGCAAIEGAIGGKLAHLKVGSKEAAQMVYDSMVVHTEGIKGTYKGEHKEKAIIINFSETHTLDKSPDNAGNQWFIYDINKSLGMLTKLLPDIYKNLNSKIDLSHINKDEFFRNVRENALRFGISVIVYLAEAKGVPLFALNDVGRKRGRRLMFNPLQDLNNLYSRYNISINESEEDVT